MIARLSNQHIGSGNIEYFHPCLNPCVFDHKIIFTTATDLTTINEIPSTMHNRMRPAFTTPTILTVMLAVSIIARIPHQLPDLDSP